MTINLTVNGVTFAYPVQNDTGWGPAATAWANAVTNGMLQKGTTGTTNLFTLLSDVDFGPSFGLQSLYYKSISSNIATAGILRLAVGDSIDWRNNANSANLALAVNASDQLTYNGTVIAIGTSFGTGSVTSVATGTGLTGGPITTAGTISIGTSGVTAGTYGNGSNIPHIIINALGQITSASNTSITIGTGSVTSIVTNNGLTAGTLTTTGTIGLATIVNDSILSNITGSTQIPTANTLSQVIDHGIGATQGMVLFRGSTTWNALLPGTSGQFLKTNGTAANPAWATATAGTGTVTSIIAGTGLTGGTVSTTGTIAIGTSGITAGTYQGIVFNALGQATSATNQSYGTGSVTSITTGTTLTGGPITTTGTLNLNLSSVNAWAATQSFVGGLTLGSGPTASSSWIDMPTTGASGIGDGGAGVNAWISYSSSANQWFTGSVIGDLNYRNRAGANIRIGIDSGGSAYPQLTINSSGLSVGYPAHLGGAIILYNGSASGAGITFQNLGGTAAYNFNMPTTAGTSGQVLTSGGGTATSMTWTTLGSGSGSVTSVSTDATLTGGAITTTGTLGINLANSNTWTASQVISLNSATAFVVGQNGATNPALTVDTSTGTSATGLSIKSLVAGSGVTLAPTSSAGSDNLTITSKGSGFISLNATTAINIAPSVITSTATRVRLSYVGGPDTALTASTEAPAIYFNIGQTRQHATGTLALQRDFRITGSIHSFVGTSTLTNAAALAIDGAPIGGSNATITNSHALYIPTIVLANVTNGFGINITAPSGAGTNYAASFTGAVQYTNAGTGGVVFQNLSGTTQYNFNLPNTSGTANQVLTSQGGGTASMTWTTLGSGTGTVTSITAGTGLTGGTITTAGTIAIGTSGVTAGTYLGLTVNTLGQITAEAPLVISKQVSYIGTATNGTIQVDSYAPFGYTITAVDGIATASGTVTAALNIGTTAITGLTAISVTATPQNVSASGANVVAATNIVNLVLSSASTPVNLQFTLAATRTT